MAVGEWPEKDGQEKNGIPEGRMNDSISGGNGERFAEEVRRTWEDI